jgi:CheY-like chemotaxis protein
VRLPLRAVAGEVLPTRPPPGQRLPGGAPPFRDDALQGTRVLVVDDEADARDLLTAVLEHHGATVVSAGSVDEALAGLALGQPEVVVSDIGMPVADGYELARRLRALDDLAGRNTPALALTGFARPEDGARALAAGFTALLAKPVDPARLVEMIARLARGEQPEAAASETSPLH